MTAAPADPHRHERRVRRLAGAVAAIIAVTLLPLPAAAVPAAPLRADRAGATAWTWPVDRFRLEEGYSAPAHPYGSGHRGVDVRPSGGDAVRAPADGVIAFSGPVADRGVVTIDHGGGLVTTLEPVEEALPAGTAVRRGAVVGALRLGGHAEPGALHIGVRLDGEYVNPLALLGEVPRAVLLPCC